MCPRNKCVIWIVIGLVLSIAMIGGGAVLHTKYENGHPSLQCVILMVMGAVASVPLVCLLAAQVWMKKAQPKRAPNALRSVGQRSATNCNSIHSRPLSARSIASVSDISEQHSRMQRVAEYVNDVNANLEHDSSYWSTSVLSNEFMELGDPLKANLEVVSTTNLDVVVHHNLQNTCNADAGLLPLNRSDIGAHEESLAQPTTSPGTADTFCENGSLPTSLLNRASGIRRPCTEDDTTLNAGTSNGDLCSGNSEKTSIAVTSCTTVKRSGTFVIRRSCECCESTCEHNVLPTEITTIRNSELKSVVPLTEETRL